MFKKIFNIISFVLVAVLLTVGLFLIATIAPIPGNYKALVVQTGSMEPAIKTGSIIVIKPAASYQIGDIVTFGPEGQTPVTHRIQDIRVQEGVPYYTTKGDANEFPDFDEVIHSDIQGKAVFTVPFVGRVVDAAKKPLGFLLLIIIPATIIVYEETKRIGREIIKLKNKGKNNEDNPQDNNSEEKEVSAP